MSSRIPYSLTDVATLIGFEATPGTVATNGKWIAYGTNSFSPNQGMIKNTENRGNRQSGTRVPDVRNPGGNLTWHQNDKTMPIGWYAALGAISAGGIAPQAAPVATLRVEAGIVTSGAHSYKYVVTDATAGTRGSGASNVVTTVEANHGQVTVSRPGVLPAGSTWALYRTLIGDAAVWVGVPGATALGEAVLSFVDNVADGSLSGTWPVSFTASDTEQVITIANTLPTFSIESKHPYLGDAAEYYVALGCIVNKATISVKSSGWFDMNLDFLCNSFGLPTTPSFDTSPDDWRGGEKIHHALAAAANVKLDGNAFGKFLDMSFTHTNNLNTEDTPVGLGGDHASFPPMEAETNFTANIVVTAPTDRSITRDVNTLHTLSIQWDYPTSPHFLKVDVAGISFDPSAPSITGPGIAKLAANGFASQPDGGQQITVTSNNGQLLTAYTT
jgi:Phage tail tube protein